MKENFPLIKNVRLNMTEEVLHQTFARLRRLSQKAEDKSGAGYVEVYLDEDEQVHLHQVKGVKSIEECEDELLNAIVWAWNIKDYLKEAANTLGEDPERIEELVNNSEPLRLISDLANGAKHGKLKKSRSGRFASLGEITMSVPQDALSKISFSKRRVDTEIADTSLVEFTVPVVANDGTILGDAGKILIDALNTWEAEGMRIAEDI